QAYGLLKFWKGTNSIQTLTESGTTVTVTTSTAPTLVVGNQVQIAGASVGGYNGTFTVTGVSGNTFTYTAATSGLASATGGTATAWHLGQLGTNSFGQKLVFAGGATGVVATILNPGTPQAKVNIYVTGSNVQQANANQIAFFQDQNGAPAGTSGSGVQ